ncbi:Leucine-rich repeat-containing G-protein coupled receptor 5 [Apodemus speciosus]|uniref:Leucine-rich repeat-containing G-protein coupled receptor 5 n=1 Tax=Apodemus speciosus TaxID=105296 RepID=A0ABQ0F8L7_APOSI
MDTSCVRMLLSLLALLQLVAAGSPPGPDAMPRGCPSHCHCELDGRMLLRVDCSDLGLSELPSNLSVFTSYLDLSMNNITQLPASLLHRLRFLEELLLMLQNNQLRQVPEEALQNLRSLQSLRLDANRISYVPPSCFSGLHSLRHLWLDDNALTDVPVQAFRSLSALQAMTLALNKIHHIADYAFGNLSSLVVLHLHDNGIHSLERNALMGSTAWRLWFLCVALAVLKLLCKPGRIPQQQHQVNTGASIHRQPFSYHNLPMGLAPCLHHQQGCLELHPPSHSVAGKPTPRMQAPYPYIHSLPQPTLLPQSSLQQGQNPAKPDTSMTIPSNLLEYLLFNIYLNLEHSYLSYNLLEDLPSLSGCQKLQKIDLRHNEIYEIKGGTFQQLLSLRSLNLAWNKIAVIHPKAFLYTAVSNEAGPIVQSPVVLPGDWATWFNSLKIDREPCLTESDTICKLPRAQGIIEMPYAYQCCAFGACENVYKISNQWNKDDSNSVDDLHKKDAGLFQVPDERDLEDLLLDFEEDLKALHSVQCSPSPGPFKPCEHLFGSWLIRIGVWTTAVLALSCNALVALTVFRTPLYISSIKLLIGVIAVVDILLGVSSAVLAGVDSFTFGRFAQHGAWWEDGIGCQIVGFLSIFASESSIFLLTLAALERGFSVKGSSKFEVKAPLSSLKAIILLCVLLALTIATVPLLGGSEYNASPLCLPLPFGEPSTTGYMVALVLLNSLCFLIMTIAYTKLYCSLEKGELENLWDCSMVKHVALLLFTNCILYCPVAFLSFSSLLNLTFISPEVIKFILLVIVPLPACLNPLLYIVFNPHFKEDMGSLGKRTHFWTRSKHPSLLSINSDDVEKRSCDSTQALVSFTHASIAYDLPSNSGPSPAYPMTESCHLSSVAFVPCL